MQDVSSRGVLTLQTRNLRYGRLENGSFCWVPAGLVERLPQHYLSLPWGADVLLGCNGGIWMASKFWLSSVHHVLVRSQWFSS